VVKAVLPLKDVVACLSGFTHDQKNELHQLIESLGGRCVDGASGRIHFVGHSILSLNKYHLHNTSLLTFQIYTRIKFGQEHSLDY
jgi:BRCA1 C Terminus (BRCT) domain